jgi:Glycosyltransferase family 87
MLSIVRRHPLWVIVAVGIAVRLVLAFEYVGGPTDIAALRAVSDFLERDFLHAYDVNDDWSGGTVIPAWPYPPAYFPWILAALGIHNLSGLPFHGVVQLAPIAADVGIAVAIYAYLGWRGAPDRLRLAGAALVMLGPSFIAISGYHGQLDSVAILPGVLALMAWERRPAATRGLDAGLLVGLGAAIKTVPGLLVLPLIAAASSLRERALLLGAAVAVPAVLFLPFFVADPGAIDWLGTYEGIRGRGGLSLVVQPSLAWDQLTQNVLAPRPSDLTETISGGSRWIVLGAVALAGAFMLRYRPAPVDGAVLLWLAVYAFVPNFLMQYLVWGLPFFVMAGYLRQTAILQLLVLPATVIYYDAGFTGGLDEGLAALYVATMIGLWVFWVAAFTTLAVRTARRASEEPRGVQPHLVRLAGT